MIPKVVEREKSEVSDFSMLGRYILDAKSNEAAVLWTRTAEYIMDTEGDGEKLAWYRITHCESDVPAMAIAEILVTQSENTRTRSDKTYHLVISFREGESPTREQLEDIEDTICAGLGLGEHQRISAVHQNTENLHLHIAINKIHPRNFRIIEPYYPYLKLDRLCQELEIKHGLEQDNRIGQGQGKGKASEMEAHTGEQSLLSWIQEHLGESLKHIQETGQSWQDVHALLAEHDLVMKPRGAGLVIVTADGKQGVKASAVDRGLSFKSLTDRFGEYQPPPQAKMEQKGQTAQNGNLYQRGPRERHPGANSLWIQYQTEKEATFRAKANALQFLKGEQQQNSQKLKAWYREQRASVKANPKLSLKSKRALYQDLSQAMRADFVQQKKQNAELRQGIQSQFPALQWDQWLVQKAEQGNSQALAVLRSRQQTRKRLAQALLTAENVDAAKHIILPHLKPITRKNGEVCYRLKDGGRVEDTANAVHVPEVTEASALLALTLASERFSGKALVVEGTTEFKVKVAEMAVVKDLNIRFADPDMGDGKDSGKKHTEILKAF
jgi:Relaxase/Mobilisation nuclease domain/Large polyvalent protein-associated domain 7